MKKIKRFFLLLTLITLDQVSKSITERKVIEISGLFSIKYSQNYGAAFGIMPGYFALFIAAAIILLTAIATHYKNSDAKTGLIFLAGGAIGNMIDRFMFHYVRDFISIWIFPIFNLADIFMWTGIIFIVYSWRKKEILDLKNKIKAVQKSIKDKIKVKK